MKTHCLQEDKPSVICTVGGAVSWHSSCLASPSQKTVPRVGWAWLWSFRDRAWPESVLDPTFPGLQLEGSEHLVPGSSLGPRLGGTQGIWKPCLGNWILRSAGPSRCVFAQGAPRLVCSIWCPWGAPPKSSLRGLVAKVGGRAWVSRGPQPTRPEGID